MTISITLPMSGPSSLWATSSRSDGQKASLVDAPSAAYLLPTLEPERTTPPGKGMITPGTRFIASTATSAACSAAAVSVASSSRLPPPTACVVTKVVS